MPIGRYVFVAWLIAQAVLLVLWLDGLFGRRAPEKLSGFPFKNLPATNGMIAAACWLIMNTLVFFLITRVVG